MSVPHRRVRLLVEVDALVFNEDMDDAALGPAVAGWVATIVREAEDKAMAEAVNGVIYPLDYRLDADDATVWTPAKYIGALLAVRGLSKTARDKLRKFDRLPASSRRFLLVDRLRRNRKTGRDAGYPGVAVYASCPGCGAYVPSEAQPRPNGSIVQQGSECPTCGRIEPYDVP